MSYHRDMIRAAPATPRVAMTIVLADGAPMTVRLSSDCLVFVGRYARLTEYGPRGTPLYVR
jgi:hypothetical protein